MDFIIPIHRFCCILRNIHSRGKFREVATILVLKAVQPAFAVDSIDWCHFQLHTDHKAAKSMATSLANLVVIYSWLSVCQGEMEPLEFNLHNCGHLTSLRTSQLYSVLTEDYSQPLHDFPPPPPSTPIEVLMVLAQPAKTIQLYSYIMAGNSVSYLFNSRWLDSKNSY